MPKYRRKKKQPTVPYDKKENSTSKEPTTDEAEDETLVCSKCMAMMSKAKKVSIVGTAGRKGDGKKMTKELYHLMYEKAKDVIENEFNLKLSDCHVVSGGAAWADHIAVALFLTEEVSSLTLHLPTKLLIDKKPQFLDTGSSDSRKNPGRTANKLHYKFSEKIKEDSLEHLKNAITVGATVFTHEGFHARNSFVAESDYLLAFTWGSEDVPKEGGTMDTWSKCRGTKYHVPLESLCVSPRKRKRESIPSHYKKVKS